MIGNISKVSRKGSKGDKGDVPSVIFSVDENGDLWCDSDGILVDKEYADSRNFVMKSEIEKLEDTKHKVNSWDEIVSGDNSIEYPTVKFMEEELNNGLAGAIQDSKDYTNVEVRKVAERVTANESQTASIKTDVADLQKHINEESHFRGYLSTNEEILSSNATPNDYAYSAESGTVWIYDEVNGWQDSGETVPDQLTPASNTTPLINGEASVGSENAYARGDHRHPTDTTRASVEDVRVNTESIAEAFNHIQLHEQQIADLSTCGDFELIESAEFTEKVAVIEPTLNGKYKEFYIRFNIPPSDEAKAGNASTQKARWGIHTWNGGGVYNQPVYNMGNQFITDYTTAWRTVIHIKVMGKYARTELWYESSGNIDNAYARGMNSSTYSGYVVPSAPLVWDYIHKLKITLAYESNKTDTSIRYLPVGTTYEIWGVKA